MGLRCEAPADVAAARIARRRAEGLDVSDATEEVAARMALAEDAWPSAVAIDSTRGRQWALDPALEVLDERQATE